MKATPPRMRLVTINRRLIEISDGMVFESHFPPDPNWIINLQDLLEEAGIDLKLFEHMSATGCGLWPIFEVKKGRPRVSSERHGSGAAEPMLNLIKTIYGIQ